jgi:hypothetical protein
MNAMTDSLEKFYIFSPTAKATFSNHFFLTVDEIFNEACFVLSVQVGSKKIEEEIGKKWGRESRIVMELERISQDKNRSIL